MPLAALALLLAGILGLQTCDARQDEPVSNSAAAASDVPEVIPPEEAWELVLTIDNPDLAEPSSLYFVAARETVLAVDDGDANLGRPAQLVEMDLQGTTLQKTALGSDLEGVCYCESNGLIYVADEHKDTIHVVDPEGLRPLGRFRLDGKVDGEKLLSSGGNGIEGIEFMPAGAGADFDRLILLNQEKPHVLLEVPLETVWPEIPEEKVEPARYWKYHPFNAGELHYRQDSGDLWLVHSWISMVEVLDPASMEPHRNIAIPGFAQEGVTIDEQQRLWIGQDTGSILIYRHTDALKEF